jgi:hypothetical protein
MLSGQVSQQDVPQARVEVMALAEDPQWCSAEFPTWLIVRLFG